MALSSVSEYVWQLNICVNDGLLSNKRQTIISDDSV